MRRRRTWLVAGLACIVLFALTVPRVANACSVLGAIFHLCDNDRELPEHYGFSVPDPGFGTHDAGRTIAALRAAGANEVRTVVSWDGSGSTPQKVVPDTFSTPLGRLPATSTLHLTDDLYLRATRAHITPILMVFSAPEWATRWRGCTDPAAELNEQLCPGTSQQRLGSANFPDVPFDGAYAAFVAAVAKRYPAAVIEGWNEPERPWYLGYIDRVWGDRLAQIQCAAYDAVKRVHPEQTVLSPSIGFVTPKFAPATEYADAYYDAVSQMKGSASACEDGESVHVYPGGGRYGAGSKLARWWRTLTALRQRHGDQQPIWITETGWSAADAPRGLFAREVPQLLRVLAKRKGVAAVVLHTLRDAPLPIYSDPNNEEYGFGWLREDWTPKDQFCALVHSADGTYAGC